MLTTGCKEKQEDKGPLISGDNNSNVKVYVCEIFSADKVTTVCLQSCKGSMLIDLSSSALKHDFMLWILAHNSIKTAIFNYGKETQFACKWSMWTD